MGVKYTPQQQQVIHQESARTAVAIGEGMDVLKLGVKICCRCQRLFRLDALQLLQQLGQLLRDILWQSAHLLWPGHIIVFLICSGALPLLVAQGIVGSLGQKPLELTEQGLIQWLPLLKGIQHPVVGRHGVLDLEQRPHIARVAGNAAMVENLPDVLVGDFVIFYSGGMINKSRPVSIHFKGNVRGGANMLFLPPGKKLFIGHGNRLHSPDSILS